MELFTDESSPETLIFPVLVRKEIINNGPNIPSQKEVSQRLNTTPSTLKRKLEKYGITYQAVVDEIRKEKAIKYLTQTNYDVKKISCILQYSEPGNFCRAFKKWLGVTPIEYRKQNSIYLLF